MRYAIRHETRCRYDAPMNYSIRQLRITPREDAGQHVEQWHVSTPVRSSRSVDAWGNTTHMFTLTEPHEEFRVVVNGVVALDDAPPPRQKHGSEPFPYAYLGTSHLTGTSPALERFAHEQLIGAGNSRGNILAGIEAVKAAVTLAPVSSGEPILGAAAAFARGAAVLHDQIHVFIAACRITGRPARFVSGYLLGDRPTEHAWVDVWMKDQGGWMSIDLRRGQIADSRLIRLAVGRDYLDACPMRTAQTGGVDENVRLSVEPLYD